MMALQRLVSSMPLLSARFFVLLSVGVVLFHLLPLQLRKAYLALCSFAFYATWGLGFSALLLVGVVIAYVSALRMAPNEDGSPSDNEAWLWGTLAAIFGNLLVFKYALPLLAGSGGAPVTALLVPLGISYYTFRLVSYVLDVRSGKLRAERDFIAQALYVAFFPQIVSGPIQRAHNFLVQLKEPMVVEADRISSGLRLILFGLFEKLVVADRLAVLVNNVFDHVAQMSGLAFLIGAYAFAIQLYADFSGLTDIALGIGRLFGIEGPRNFDNPFYAPNIQAFWRRWHISLTSWLADYLFTPLNVAFRSWGNLGLFAAIFINMIAVGVWHGARWTFLVFGILNGIYFALSAFTLRSRDRFFRVRPRLTSLRSLTGPLLTFHLMAFAFIFFRASSMHDALFYVAHLIPDRGLPGSAWGLRRMGIMDQLGIIGIACIPLMELVHWARPRGLLTWALKRSPLWLRWTAYYAAVLMVAILGQTEAQNFIYAQF